MSSNERAVSRMWRRPRSSKEEMKGEIVRRSSGVVGPMGVQFARREVAMELVREGGAMAKRSERLNGWGELGACARGSGGACDEDVPICVLRHECCAGVVILVGATLW
jgi:hypothetical protein